MQIDDLSDTVLDGFDFPTPEPAKVETPVTPVENEPLKPQDFGGDRFDASGNLIKDGRIFKTKEVIENERGTKVPDNPSPVKKEEEVPEEHTIDKNGNLVNSKNEIYKKKGEFTINDKGEVTLEEAKFVDSLVTLAKEKGYVFNDETGNPIEFDESEEGYFAIAQNIAQQETIKSINDFFESEPELKNLALHLQAGKNAIDYYTSRVNTVDYTKAEAPVDQVDQEMLIINMYKQVYNLPEAEAKSMASLIKDAGNLEPKSREALGVLKEHQVQAQLQSQQQAQQAIQEQQQERLETLQEINSVITKGSLGSIQIPDSKRGDFYNYLTKEIEPGVTRSTKDFSALSMDKRLMLEYLLYTGLNIDELVKVKMNTEKADLISKRGSAKAIVIKSSPHYQTQASVVPDLDKVN